MSPGHMELCYYLRSAISAITGNEDLGEMCLLGTVICSQKYHSFPWQ